MDQMFIQLAAIFRPLGAPAPPEILMTQPTDRPTDRPTDGPNGRTDQPTDRPTDQPTNQSINQINKQTNTQEQQQETQFFNVAENAGILMWGPFFPY